MLQRLGLIALIAVRRALVYLGWKLQWTVGFVDRLSGRLQDRNNAQPEISPDTSLDRIGLARLGDAISFRSAEGGSEQAGEPLHHWLSKMRKENPPEHWLRYAESRIMEAAKPDNRLPEGPQVGTSQRRTTTEDTGTGPVSLPRERADPSITRSEPDPPISGSPISSSIQSRAGAIGAAAAESPPGASNKQKAPGSRDAPGIRPGSSTPAAPAGPTRLSDGRSRFHEAIAGPALTEPVKAADSSQRSEKHVKLWPTNNSLSTQRLPAYQKQRDLPETKPEQRSIEDRPPGKSQVEGPDTLVNIDTSETRTFPRGDRANGDARPAPEDNIKTRSRLERTSDIAAAPAAGPATGDAGETTSFSAGNGPHPPAGRASANAGLAREDTGRALADLVQPPGIAAAPAAGPATGDAGGTTSISAGKGPHPSSLQARANAGIAREDTGSALADLVQPPGIVAASVDGFVASGDSRYETPSAVGGRLQNNTFDNTFKESRQLGEGAWPDLPEPALSGPGLDSETVAAKGKLEAQRNYSSNVDFPASEDLADLWPALPGTGPLMSPDRDAESGQRARMHRQRLELEQRGILWNESPF